MLVDQIADDRSAGSGDECAQCKHDGADEDEPALARQPDEQRTSCSTRQSDEQQPSRGTSFVEEEPDEQRKDAARQDQRSAVRSNQKRAEAEGRAERVDCDQVVAAEKPAVVEENEDGEDEEERSHVRAHDSTSSESAPRTQQVRPQRERVCASLGRFRALRKHAHGVEEREGVKAHAEQNNRNEAGVRDPDAARQVADGRSRQKRELDDEQRERALTWRDDVTNVRTDRSKHGCSPLAQQPITGFADDQNPQRNVRHCHCVQQNRRFQKVAQNRS